MAGVLDKTAPPGIPVSRLSIGDSGFDSTRDAYQCNRLHALQEGYLPL
jgi:hypothetical protein